VLYLRLRSSGHLCYDVADEKDEYAILCDHIRQDTKRQTVSIPDCIYSDQSESCSK
jgi:hypothetical protein